MILRISWGAEGWFSRGLSCVCHQMLAGAPVIWRLNWAGCPWWLITWLDINAGCDQWQLSWSCQNVLSFLQHHTRAQEGSKNNHFKRPNGKLKGNFHHSLGSYVASFLLNCLGQNMSQIQLRLEEIDSTFQWEEWQSLYFVIYCIQNLESYTQF